jgi:hypothetical protein
MYRAIYEGLTRAGMVPEKPIRKGEKERKKSKCQSINNSIIFPSGAYGIIPFTTKIGTLDIERLHFFI